VHYGESAVSILTIPVELYRQIRHNAYARYRKAGMEPAAALQRSQELMDNAFAADAIVLDTEYEWDRHSPENQRWHE
jgi:hypothetical protein